MTKEDKKVAIYAPPHFKATWRKFLEICERDGQSGSELVRIWVEGYVARKDPGNPQRPLTAYVPGHEDERALWWGELRRKLQAIAERANGELGYWRILDALKPHFDGVARVDLADRMARELTKAGVRILQ